MISRILFLLLSALVLPAAAQIFPSKPIRIIVVYPPGGANMKRMRKSWRKPG